MDHVGSTLETLRLETGYWRWRLDNPDVRRCRGTTINIEACTGGDTADEELDDPGVCPLRTGAYCKPGLAGPYCTACNDTELYFDATSVAWIARERTSSSSTHHHPQTSTTWTVA